MKKKNILFTLASILMISVLMVVPTQVKAANLTNTIYFGVQEFRSGTTPNNLAYGINDPYANGATTEEMKGTKIWQIVKYNSSTGGNYTTGNYYCVRSGVGFRNVNDIATYNRSYDLKSDKNAILNSGNKYLKNIVENGYFNNLLALTDLLYLDGETTEQEREALIQAAGIDTTQYNAQLTNSDIEAVQQAAIWYFSNHDDATFENIFNNYDEEYMNGNEMTKTSWLTYSTLEDAQAGKLNYKSFSDYNLGVNSEGKKSGDGMDRQEQATILYNYLIYTANQNAALYENGTATSKTKVTLYVNATDDNVQPIILVEKLPEQVKEFDLALSKYVTKVGDVTLTGSNSRVPNIDTTTIDTEKTATYKHRKDPVIVKTGDTVTYNLTIYNEGDKAGRATKIVDQLPTGLQFTKLITEGFTAEYDEQTNRLTIVRKAENTTNLEAYKNSELKSETIEIEAIVTATATTTGDKILTNVAWISEEYDAEAQQTITNQSGADRDSEPSTTPNVNKDNMSDYIGNTSNKKDLTDPNYYYKGEQDDDDFEKLVLKKQNEGIYNVVLIKQDSKGNQLNSQATFDVNGQIKNVTGKLEIANNVSITSENVGTADTYVIKETVAPNTYTKFNGTITVTVTKKLENSVYKVDTVSFTVTDENGKDITDSVANRINVYLNTDGNVYVEVKNYQFDLKLVKRIVEVNGVKVPERIENVDITNLANGTATTAEYTVNKEPVAVKKGDIVKYTFRVYNEGNIDGYASEITEDIPEGLEFMWSENLGDDLQNDTTLTDDEKKAIEYNQIRWTIKEANTTTNKATMVSTDYLAKGKGAEIRTEGANLIKAFDSTKGYINNISEKNPDYKEISIYMKVVSDEQTGTQIRNETAITGDTDEHGNPVDDRDSSTEEWKKYEDDEDYDLVRLESFDLALRKFIIAVSSDEKIDETDYLKNADGTYTRAPKVDTTKLNTIDENDKLITTAIYEHSKEPVQVNKGDMVVYMLRVYNEGDINGYASEIKDYLPEYLEYVDNDFNKQYGWTVSADGRTVTTNYLDNHMIEKVTKNDDGKIVLSYKEVPVMCKVKTDIPTGQKQTNIAEITVNKDENKKTVSDRDSKINNVVLPSDNELPEYKDDEKGSYIPGQEDDDDFDKIIVKRFDLALRKFITGVNNDDVTTRIPQVKYDEENNKITYEHSKEPVEVVTNDTVIYTIRVFNEGEVDGYASKVSDDIPQGLEYLPDNELNKEYRWVMYDSEGNETTDVEKAVKITTDYLSKAQGEARMAKDTTIEENPALLRAFDANKEISDTNPDYADVKVAFKVVEKNESDKIIINSAQITDDTDKNGNPIDDDDSTPDKWIDGEDDQDQEKIKLTYFDLALRKWVTQAIVIENGKETVTQTGHTPDMNPEPAVKVELNRKKLDSVTVKFKYSIRVTNEGDIAGYAKEITDYVPQGLKFVASDNPNWNDEGNNVISTRALENTLLQPGQSADVEVTLTWINGKNNFGLKTNIAEISEDDNDKDVPDRDSTPDNQVPGEDDQDEAPVILSIATGIEKTYIGLTCIILVTVAAGIILIKKYVL